MTSLRIGSTAACFAIGARSAMKRGCCIAMLLFVLCIVILVGWFSWELAKSRSLGNGPGVSQDYIEEHGLPEDFNTRRYVLP